VHEGARGNDGSGGNRFSSDRRLKGLEEFTDADALPLYSQNQDVPLVLSDQQRGYSRRDRRQVNRSSEPRGGETVNWGLLFLGLLLGACAGLIMIARDGPSLLADVQRADPPANRAFEAPSIGPPVHYSGCNEVRALGKAPLYRGQPGYSTDMDGDLDGIACEPHAGAEFENF
jgi:hypothetical protein